MPRKKAVSPLDLLNPKAYSKDQRMMIDRWRTCRECDRLDATFRCRECGCFMKGKVRLSAAECPLGKWAAEADAS